MEGKTLEPPDWYNNSCNHDWEYAVRSLIAKTTYTHSMFALSLIGKVASNADHNFDDWTYNNSVWWPGTINNWAGGGGPVTGDGDTNLYLMNWSGTEAVGILENWVKDLALDSTRLNYWSLDNEPDI